MTTIHDDHWIIINRPGVNALKGENNNADLAPSSRLLQETNATVRGYCLFIVRLQLVLSPVPLVLDNLCYLGLNPLYRLCIV